MPTAITHDPIVTFPASSTSTALVRWSGTGGNTLLDTSGILSDGSNITLNARGEVRFSDADSSHYIAFESPATVSTSYTMTLPADLPAANEVLTVTSYSSGAGVLEWAAGSSNSFTNDVTITSGNLVVATAGRGIDFSASTDSSTGTDTSELLDDYEEGTWTPRISEYSNIGSSGAYHAANTKGTYTRIGRLCHFQCYLALDHAAGGYGTESGSGTVVLTPLPFTCGDREVGVSVGHNGSMALTAGYNIGGYINANTTRIRLHLNDHANGQSELLFSEFSSDGLMILAGTYEIA